MSDVKSDGMSNLSADSIECYLAALTRRLRWTLPDEKVNSIVDETRAHLLDRADDLMVCGISQGAAEAAAIAGFGPVAAFSRAMARSAFEDAASVRARTLSAVMGCGLLVFTLLWAENGIRIGGWLSLPAVSGLPLSRGAYFGIAAFAVFLISAFFGKRPQTALFSGVGLLCALTMFVYAGQTKVIDPYHHSVWPRSEIAEHRPDPNYEKMLASDVRLLTRGCEVFAQPNDVAPVVPPELFSDGAIIVPSVNVLPTTGGFSEDALRQEPTMAQFDALPQDDPNPIAYHAIFEATPYHTEADTKEAAKDWRKLGKPWLAVRADTLRNYQITEQWWAKVQANTPQGFSFPAACSDAIGFLFGLPMFLILEALAAFAGQHAHRLRRNGRHGTYA